MIFSIDLFKGRGIDEMASCNLFQPQNPIMLEQELENGGNIFSKGEWAIRSEWECEPVIFSFISSAMYSSKRYNQGTIKYYLYQHAMMVKGDFFFLPWCNE